MKPMLSATIKPGDETKLRVPLVLSPKLDGIRCVIDRERGPVSRNMKPIPNNFVREWLNENINVYTDGELLLRGYPENGVTFNDVQSAIMSRDGEPDFVYAVFDSFANDAVGWEDRTIYWPEEGDRIMHVPHFPITRWEQVLEWEQQFVARGYEGVMLRDPDGLYKYGRSTLREQGLMKLKRFLETEVTCTGFVERLHNANELEKDELGYAKRSSHKDNMVPMGTLGALVVRHPEWGEFNVGTGFTDAQRQEIWDNPARYQLKTLTVKHEPVMRERPRFPVFLHWREDLS